MSTALVYGNAIHKAIRESVSKPEEFSQRLSDLVKSSPQDVLEKDIFGLTPLHLAVRLGEFSDQAATVRVLLEAGASAQTQTYTGKTALEEAARHDSDVLYELLLPHCPDSNTPRQTYHPTWAPIRADLSQIFWSPQINNGKIVLRIYDNVTLAMTASGKPRRPATENNELLYKSLRGFLTVYVREIAAFAKELEVEAFTKFYCEQWPAYEKYTKQAATAFAYLDRHYTTRVRAEEESRGRISMKDPVPLVEEIYPDTKTSSLLTWKTGFLDVDDRLVLMQSELRKDNVAEMDMFEAIYKGLLESPEYSKSTTQQLPIREAV